MARDLTQGTPLKQLLLFSVPILLGSLFQQLYGMVDAVIVGQCLGENAMAAVGSTGAVQFFILGFARGTSTGFTIRTAQAFGMGDKREIRRSVRCCLILAFWLSIIMTALSVPLMPWLLRFMKTPDDLLHDAVLYIQVICGGLFSAIFYNIMASILRALGDSRTPLVFLIISALLNVVLDLLLIAGFKMGVEGAALATIIAQAISAAACYAYGLRHCEHLHTGSERGQITGHMYRDHLSIGVPMGLQFSITAIGSMMLQSAFNRFGTAGATAYVVACKVEGLIMQPGEALAVTMSTYMGQNLGAKRYDRIARGIRSAMIIGVCFSLFAVLFVNVLGEGMIGLFFADEMTAQIRDWAMLYLRVSTAFYIFLSGIFIFRDSMQGLGNRAVPMTGGVVELIARVSVSALLPGLVGYIGACLAPCAAWIGAGMLNCICYFHTERRWRRQGLIKGGKAT